MTKRHDRQWRVDWLLINYRFLDITSKRLWCRSRNFASGLLSAGIRQSSMNSALSLSDVNLCLNVTRLSAKSKSGTQSCYSFIASIAYLKHLCQAPLFAKFRLQRKWKGWAFRAQSRQMNKCRMQRKISRPESSADSVILEPLCLTLRPCDCVSGRRRSSQSWAGLGAEGKLCRCSDCRGSSPESACSATRRGFDCTIGSSLKTNHIRLGSNHCLPRPISTRQST